MNSISIPKIISPDPNHQKQLRNLLDNLKSSDPGLENCLKSLENYEYLSKNDELFWLMVLEHQVKVRYLFE